MTHPEMKDVKIVIETNALGCISTDVMRIPLSEFSEGEPKIINGVFPPVYMSYIDTIKVTVKGNTLSVESKYKTETIEMTPYSYIILRDIGLSYAYCNIEISAE